MTRFRAALIATCISAAIAPSAHAIVGGTSVPAGERGWGALGELDLGQWWLLQARHEGDHGQQLHAIRTHPAFPVAP